MTGDQQSECVLKPGWLREDMERAADRVAKGFPTPREYQLDALVREVTGARGEYTGPEGACRALNLFSRLAESGWFKRAEAVLDAWTPPPADAGRCKVGDACVCGGDTPDVRSGCRNWITKA